MIYLTGTTNNKMERHLIRAGVGLMAQPGNGYLTKAPLFPAYAADNGCFSKTATFCADKWLRWLATAPIAGCLFATAPDVVGDHDATLIRCEEGLRQIRGLGLPAAFVGQDGAIPATVPWDTFDVLFIGGSTEWKLGAAAAELVAEAKERGMWAHMGRVNSLKRMKYAMSIGCDSVDGTFLAFGPDKNLPQLISWMQVINSTLEAA